MIRRLVPAAAIAVAVLLPGTGAPAQGTGCTLPPNPGGTIDFSQAPPDYVVGTNLLFSFDFNDYAESNYAIDFTYEIDGPDGHHSLRPQTSDLPFVVPALGDYTITAHWTESCDGVTADRRLASATAAFRGVGPPAPYGGLQLRQGTRREPAAALLNVGCPTGAVDEPLRVSARVAGHTVSATVAHGCRGPRFGRTSTRRGARWELRADAQGARIFVKAPARLVGHLELRSGDRVVAAADIRFRPRRGRERASTVRL